MCCNFVSVVILDLLDNKNISKLKKCYFQIDYLGLDWSGSLEISHEIEEFRAINMESDSDTENNTKQLSLNIHANRKHSMDLYVYSPYWLVNKTGLPLQFRVGCLQYTVICFFEHYRCKGHYIKYRLFLLLLLLLL